MLTATGTPGSSMSIDLRYTAGPIARAWAALYGAVGTDPLPRSLATAPDGSQAYLGTLYRGSPPAVAAWSRPHSAVRDNGTTIVLFTGGKDSTAAAIRARAAGRQLLLLHARGMNPAYPGELASATAVAGALRARLAVVDVRITRGAYITNPIKNQMLLAIAADLAPRYGAGELATGIHWADTVADLGFRSGFSDAIEMHEAAADCIEGAVDGLRVARRLIENDSDALLTVADAGLLPLVGSCMATVRFRASLHARNQAKFGGALMPGRCGSCYKCALEWLHLALTERAPWQDALAAHSVAVLRRGAELITGRRPDSLADMLRLFFDTSRVSIERLSGAGAS